MVFHDVSIPNRDFDKLQLAKIEDWRDRLAQFQSLIGILINCNKVGRTFYTAILYVFQSLIGILINCNLNTQSPS